MLVSDHVHFRLNQMASRKITGTYEIKVALGGGGGGGHINVVDCS